MPVFWDHLAVSSRVKLGIQAPSRAILTRTNAKKTVLGEFGMKLVENAK